MAEEMVELFHDDYCQLVNSAREILTGIADKEGNIIRGSVFLPPSVWPSFEEKIKCLAKVLRKLGEI